jgi:ribosome-associated translation inhibitor RaiA
LINSIYLFIDVSKENDMTQLESAKNGEITAAMRQVAEQEMISPEKLCESVASGEVVIPKNINHHFKPRGIGMGLRTKVNANIGTSPSHFNLEEELAKLKAAIDAGTDAVMDLSTGGDLAQTLSSVLKNSTVMVGTVPIYRVVSALFSKKKSVAQMTADQLLKKLNLRPGLVLILLPFTVALQKTAWKYWEGVTGLWGWSRGEVVLSLNGSGIPDMKIRFLNTMTGCWKLPANMMLLYL